MKNILRLIGVLAIVAFIVLNVFVYVVDQTQTGILLEFGKPKGGPLQPGIHFRVPGLHKIVIFDARLLEYDAQAREVITRDKKNLKVDNFARWRIIEPLTFYNKVRDVYRAQERLDDIIYSLLREELGKYNLIDIVANDRTKIMLAVTLAANEAAKQYGIEVTDVRIKRADLPDENAKHVYDRMKAERTRQAKRYRAEGEEASRKLKSQADKEHDIILAEAYRKAEEIRGEGDGKATKIYAKAYGKDPEFYAFVKSLEVYRKSIGKDDVLVLSPQEPLFKYMRSEKAK